MESLLWALDLLAVAYLCLWALKQDKGKDKAAREGKQHDA
jgi:hypothetical protein